MNNARFDAWTRRLAAVPHGRRRLLQWLRGSLVVLLAPLDVGETAAKPRRKRCRKRKRPGQKCKTKHGAKCKCQGGAKCQGKRCRCPGGRLACDGQCCAAGQVCLSNGSCATPCTAVEDCPEDCFCASNLDAPVCETRVDTCEDIPQVCTSTAQCPRGQVCRQTGCGNLEDRCIPLCGV